MREALSPVSKIEALVSYRCEEPCEELDSQGKGKLTGLSLASGDDLGFLVPSWPRFLIECGH